MKPRILFGGLFHETHTFLPELTSWEDFEVSRGDEIHSMEGDESPTAGFLEAANEFGWTVAPTIHARAMPSGPVDDAAFEIYWTEFERRAHVHLVGGIDAVFLVLHGAMATKSIDDVEGELLARVRRLPGAASLPLFGVLDLHGNISARMCGLANGFVAYRKNPHVDGKATAVRAAGLLRRCLETRRVPRMEWCRVPVMWPPPGTGTQSDPMKALTTFAAEIEQRDSAVWACNVMAGFSFADTADSGVTLSVVTDGDATNARKYLEAGAQLAWKLRDRGIVSYPAVDDVLERIGPNPAGPVLLVEPADNIGGGAPGDGTGILRAMISRGVTNGLVAINDPAAVQRLSQVAVGQSAVVEIGGHGWRLDAGPLSLDVRVISRSDGAFELEDPHSHLASMGGTHVEMGACAVVRHRGITILLTTRKTPPFDLGQFRSQGVEPTSFSIIGVKAAVAHRQAYDPIAKASYFVDTPGPCSSALATFPYTRVRRPIFPLDPIDSPELIFS